MPSYTLIKHETLEHQASACLLSFLGNMSFSPLFSSFLIACTQRYGLQEMPFSQHTHFYAAWAHRPCHRLDGVMCCCLASPGPYSLMNLRYSQGILQGDPGACYPEAVQGSTGQSRIINSMPMLLTPEASLGFSGHLHF